MGLFHLFKLPHKSKQRLEDDARGPVERPALFMSYDSHIPVLNYALDRHYEFVLEVGSGLSSTPLIFKKGHNVASYENNKDWYDKVHSHLKENRLFSERNNYIYTDKLFASVRDMLWNSRRREHFNLAFIDSDVWMDRCRFISLIKGQADVILLHDSFDEHLTRCGWQDANGITWELPYFKYRLNLYPVLPPNMAQPPTLILSDTVDVTKWEVPGLTPG